MIDIINKYLDDSLKAANEKVQDRNYVATDSSQYNYLSVYFSIVYVCQILFRVLTSLKVFH